MGKILIVDDDPTMVVALKEILEERGHTTRSAASGVEALSKISDADLVLTDLQMPGMSGIELLREIREQDHAGDTPHGARFGETGCRRHESRRPRLSHQAV